MKTVVRLEVLTSWGEETVFVSLEENIARWNEYRSNPCVETGEQLCNAWEKLDWGGGARVQADIVQIASAAEIIQLKRQTELFPEYPATYVELSKLSTFIFNTTLKQE